MKDTAKSDNKRTLYLDILRCIACIAVIFIHVSATYASTADLGSLNYWAGHSVDSIFRFGVPLFLMISGALMLDESKKYTIKDILFKVLRLVIFYFVWSILYLVIYSYIVPAILGHELDLDVANIITKIVKGHFHLWYIPMCIGVYLLVPLLKLFVKKANKKIIGYGLNVMVIFAIILPTIFDILGYFNVNVLGFDLLFSKIEVFNVFSYLTFFVLGWYLHNFGLKKRGIWYALGFVSAGAIIAGSYFLSVYLDKRVLLYRDYHITTFFMAIAVFILIRTLFINKTYKKKNFLHIMTKSLAKCSLGVYAMHVGYSYCIYRLFYHYAINNALAVIPCAFLGGLLLSWLSSYLLGLIPGVKKIV